MQTLLDRLTAPVPSKRTWFMLCTARAITLKGRRDSTDTMRLASRAIAVAIANDLFPVPLGEKGYGQLLNELAEVCQLMMRGML